jgi:hypothetical protein
MNPVYKSLVDETMPTDIQYNNTVGVGENKQLPMPQPPMPPPPLARENSTIADDASVSGKRGRTESLAGDSEFGSVADGGANAAGSKSQKTNGDVASDEDFPAAPPAHGIASGAISVNEMQKTVPMAVLTNPEFRLESTGDFNPVEFPFHLFVMIDMSPSMGYNSTVRASTDANGENVICAAHSAAQMMRGMAAYLTGLLDKMPESCRAGAPNEPTLCVAGFSGQAGWHDTNDFLTNGRFGNTDDKVRAWATLAVGDDDKLKEQTVKWSECGELCTIWADHLEAIIYPDNNPALVPPGIRGVPHGNGTNLELAIAFATEALDRICLKTGGHGHCLLATDGEANSGRTSQKYWLSTIREHAMDRRANIGLPVSYSALMMGDETSVHQLSKFTAKTGLLGYASKPEEIKQGLDSILDLIVTDGRGTFDIVSVATYVDADGTPSAAHNPEITVTRSGILMADNYEGFYNVHTPKRITPFRDVPVNSCVFLTDKYSLKIESWVAPSLVARMFRSNADFASKQCAIGLDELRRTIDAFADVERHEVLVPVSEVKSENRGNFFERSLYMHDPHAAPDSDYSEFLPKVNFTLETSAPKDNIYVFVKNNARIDEEAYERFALAATHEETSMIASEMAMRSMRTGSKRSATKYGKLARQSTAYAKAAEEGDEDALYRSVGHSAAAALSQVNGDEEE